MISGGREIGKKPVNSVGPGSSVGRSITSSRAALGPYEALVLSGELHKLRTTSLDTQGSQSEALLQGR